MNRIIVYKSKTGFTEKYAKWLGEELNCPISSLDRFRDEEFYKFDCLIYVGGLYAVGINGLPRILKLIKGQNEKELIVVGVGITPPREADIKTVIENNFNEREQKEIKFFYVRGGFDYKKLSRADKILMTLLKWKISLKKRKTADEKGMLEAYERPLDFSRRENIKEIVEFVKG